MNVEDITSLAFVYEKQFSINSYKGNLISKVPFSIVLGSTPVLVSIPHPVILMRNGILKVPEVYTGALGYLLHSLTNCSLIFSTGYSNNDPNYQNDCSYKKHLRNFLIQNNVQAVIDLHGAAGFRDFDIDLGTMHGKTLGELPIEKLTEYFNLQGINNVKLNHTFSANSEYTVTAYIHENFRIPCVQLEINERLRRPDNNPERFFSLVRALSHIIENFKEVFDIGRY